MAQPYVAAGIEPPLEELLNDPITLLLMQRDGIGLAEVWRAVAAGRSRLQASMRDAEQEPRGVEPAFELSPDLGTDSPAG